MARLHPTLKGWISSQCAMRIGVIGCGNISGIYFENLAKWPETEVVACADLDLSKAEAAAARYGVPKACSPEEVLNDQSIGLVLNLTVPKAHFDVCMAAIQGRYPYDGLGQRTNDGVLVGSQKKGRIFPCHSEGLE